MILTIFRAHGASGRACPPPGRQAGRAGDQGSSPVLSVLVGSLLALCLIVVYSPESRADSTVSAAEGAQTPVRVEFIKPENFTDAGISFGVRTDDPKDVLAEFKRHFESLGQRCLPAHTTLTVRVLDVRLAGETEPWHRNISMQNVRFMREVTWPAMDLEYAVTDAGGAITRQDHAHLSDPNYLHGSGYVSSGLERFPYEKNMISRWFEHEFCQDPRTQKH